MAHSRTDGTYGDRSRGLPLVDALVRSVPAAGGLGSGRRRLDPLQEAALKILDRLVAFAGLVVAAPVLLLIAIAVKADSRGPVLHRQLRVGKDRRNGTSPTDDEAGRRTGDLGGRPFVIYKFRTMHVDAEEDCGPTWASSEDDRTTRIGGFLRRHRLDELPQLWNVLKGDMAIVGPRPERPAIFQRLREEIDGYDRRQAVRPGITGWAQINRPKDQSVDDVEQKLRYDLDYLEHRSLGVDIRIMLKTPLVMLDPDLVGEARTARGNGTGTLAPPATGSADGRADDRRRMEVSA